MVLNKTDLVDEEGLTPCEEAIRAVQPDIPIFHTTYGQISLQEILAEKDRQMPASEESTNTESTRPVTVTLSTTEAVSKAALQSFLKTIAPSTYRIKGFCRTTEGTVDVSMVGEQFHMDHWPINISQTQLVIISSVSVRIISEVLSSAKGCFQEKFDLK